MILEGHFTIPKGTQPSWTKLCRNYQQTFCLPLVRLGTPPSVGARFQRLAVEKKHDTPKRQLPPCASHFPSRTWTSTKQRLWNGIDNHHPWPWPPRDPCLSSQNKPSTCTNKPTDPTMHIKHSHNTRKPTNQHKFRRSFGLDYLVLPAFSTLVFYFRCPTYNDDVLYLNFMSIPSNVLSNVLLCYLHFACVPMLLAKVKLLWALIDFHGHSSRHQTLHSCAHAPSWKKGRWGVRASCVPNQSNTSFKNVKRHDML